jgi:hypothetical protein
MENKYAIIENSLVVNVTIASAEFAQSQGWVEMPEYVDGMAVGIGWFYSDGVFLSPPAPNYLAQNKAQAESLLQQTDWTATIDIADPAYSNPYLTNQAEFLSYRSEVRAIAINPPTTPVEWPVKPQESWS